MSAPLTLRHRLGGYDEFHPTDELVPFVESLWLHRTPWNGFGPLDLHHRVLPDPAFSLSFACVRDANDGVTQPQLLVLGPVTTPRVFPITPGYELVSVKIKLEWARAVVGVDPWPHANRLDDAGDADLGWARFLSDRLSDTRSASQALTLLASALAQRIHRGHSTPDRWVAPRALDAIRRRGGRVDLDRLAADLGVTTRHLRRTVRAESGMSPKWYARTIRFLNVITRADGLQRPPWARLSAEGGYTDQSHLIRECRAFSGLSPRRLFHERRAESEISNPLQS